MGNLSILPKFARKGKWRAMRIAIAADHAGYDLKEKLKKHLEERGHAVIDVGAHEFRTGDDYPDFAQPAAELVSRGAVDRGIVICDSGIGVDIVANKVPGVRSALVHDEDLARRTREHNDTNVLSLGSMLLDDESAYRIADAWLDTPFSREERHARRIHKIGHLEEHNVTLCGGDIDDSDGE
jgi:ribose 5-phosphate isomerase B